MKHTVIFLVFIVLLGLQLTSCGNDDVENPNPPNEEELITTVVLTFSPTIGDDIIVVWKDEDGPGGNPPSQIDDIVLMDSENYEITVQFLNESNPADVEDITLEILAEGDEHQVFFTGPVIGNQVSFMYSDEDVNGNPIGLNGLLSTLTTGSGEFIVTLKHQPGIKTSTTGISDGDTDIEVVFDLQVQ